MPFYFQSPHLLQPSGLATVPFAGDASGKITLGNRRILNFRNRINWSFTLRFKVTRCTSRIKLLSIHLCRMCFIEHEYREVVYFANHPVLPSKLSLCIITTVINLPFSFISRMFSWKLLSHFQASPCYPQMIPWVNFNNQLVLSASKALMIFINICAFGYTFCTQSNVLVQSWQIL